MAVNKRLLQGAAAAPGGITPSEHFGVVLYEGDGTTSHSINGGKFGAGAYFGGDSVIDTGLSTTNFVSNLNDRTVDFSFSCWAQIHSYPQGDNTIFYIGNYNVYSPAYAAIILDFRNATKKIRFTHETQYIESTSTFNAPMTTWVHVAAVRDNSVLKLYINGSLEANVTLTANTQVSSSTTLDIGGFQFGAGTIYSDFVGKLDQVRVFQKALSSSEVSTLYAETAETATSLDPLSEDTTDTLQVLGDSSCIATYRFENDEVDLSGNYNGTGTQIQYAAGRYGQGADFNGTTSQITTSNIIGLDTTTISISCWVYMHEVSTFNHFVSRFGTGGASTYQFILRNTSAAKWSLATYDGTGSGDSLTSTATASANTWYHVAAVIDGTSKKIYVNGSEVASSTVAFSVNTSSGEGLNIGGRDDFGASNTERMNGVIDQLRVFNKALSASEVTTLYNENSLVASYRFEGNANDDTRNYDGTASNVTYEYGLNFTPDFVWTKARTVANSHALYDSTRGINKELNTNAQAPESSLTDGISSFDTGGFTVGARANSNQNGQDFVAWCLKANGGTTTTGTGTGGVQSVTHQLNDTVGFCITRFTSNNNGGTSGGSTVTHGLDSTPDFIIMKVLNSTQAWWVWHNSFTSGNDFLQLQTSDAKGSSVNVWSGTAPDSTKVTLGAWNNQGWNYIMYAFKNVEGFSKFGSYTGTGATGNIVETGFEPSFVLIKRTDVAGGSWAIIDNKRSTSNPRDEILFANLTDTEYANNTNKANFLSNGFTLESSGGHTNASGGTYIYMAFAADPDTEAPAVAKSFAVQTYSGNSSTQTLDGFGFKPSMIWFKGRTVAYDHGLYDSVRGGTSLIYPDLSQAASTVTNGIFSFDDDGVTFGANNKQNASDSTYVAWAWKADDNEPTINTEGSINSLVSANANAGFSIVKYEGNDIAGATIGHGLSSAPEMIIVKNISQAVDWAVYHTSIGNANYLSLNNTWESLLGSSHWNSTSPTSTVFTVGNAGAVNDSSINYIAYCFHSVSGYSKIGSYTGNGTAGHSITGLGFQPDWIMIKRTTAAHNWVIADSVRGDQISLFPNLSNAESDQGGDDLVSLDSNGFTVGTNTRVNSNGDTFIYMAFKIN